MPNVTCAIWDTWSNPGKNVLKIMRGPLEERMWGNKLSLSLPFSEEKKFSLLDTLDFPGPKTPDLAIWHLQVYASAVPWEIDVAPAFCWALPGETALEKVSSARVLQRSGNSRFISALSLIQEWLRK